MTRGELGARLAANLSVLFTELPFLERFAAAARAGFNFVEFQFPYAFNFSEIRDAIAGAGVELVMHNFPAGNWEAGERGLAAVPGAGRQFAESIELGLKAARALQTPRMNCLAGIAGADVAAVRAVLVENFALAAAKLAEEGRDLLIEPLNNINVPGFALNRTGEVLSLLDAIGADNAYLQLDIYHAHIMGEDIPGIIETSVERIGHVQFADAPGRHEPGSGGIDFARIFDCLAASGYQGKLGCEYLPRGTTGAGLVWRERIFPS